MEKRGSRKKFDRVVRTAFVRSVDFTERTVTVVASTDQLCSDNMILLSRAWQQDYEEWLRTNPVVLAYHIYSSPPPFPWAIGTVIRGQIELGKTIDTLWFDDNPVHVDAIIAWGVYSKGIQRAVSVGWDTLEADMDLPIGEVLARYTPDLHPDTVQQLIDEGKRSPQRKVTVVTRARRLEDSLVNVGADNKALVIHSTPTDFFGRAATPELLQAAERAGLQFAKACTGCRGERPGWEDTTPDDAGAGQIRYRVKEPSLFKQDSFRTLPLDVKGEGDVQLMRGKLSDNDEWATQAVHFNKADGWAMGDAKDWWKEHERGGKFGKILEQKIQEAAMDDYCAEKPHPGEKAGDVTQERMAGFEARITALEAMLAATKGGEKAYGLSDREHIDGLKARVERAEADALLRRKLKAIGGGK